MVMDGEAGTTHGTTGVGMAGTAVGAMGDGDGIIGAMPDGEDITVTVGVVIMDTHTTTADTVTLITEDLAMVMVTIMHTTGAEEDTTTAIHLLPIRCEADPILATVPPEVPQDTEQIVAGLI